MSCAQQAHSLCDFKNEIHTLVKIKVLTIHSLYKTSIFIFFLICFPIRVHLMTCAEVEEVANINFFAVAVCVF